MKKKIIDGDKMVRGSARGNYIRLTGINDKVNTLEVKEVRIIGKVKGVKEQVELILDKKRFFEWLGQKKIQLLNLNHEEKGK